MNIEIFGRHALFFDDDTTAAFINSDDALVEWNSLLIDRYDVRHLLSTPPPSRRRRNPQTSHSSSADAEIDYERYLDLPSHSEEQEEDAELENPEPVGGFNAVPFSYGNYEDSNGQRTAEAESEIPGFCPPFPVPDCLIQNLPPTEKVHQIIARTALFVGKNGGQSEIVLRVKQGDNPTFGFLMPDHHLHPYFRFLVDHQDLLHEKTSNTEALSLLGSVYGTGEDDDDGGAEHTSSSKECVLPAGKDEPVSNRSLSSTEDAFIIKKNSLSNLSKSGITSSLRKGESSSALPDKSRASSLPPIPKTEHILLVDPSPDMKQLVDKIVEFIIKNGRQFEAVLMEQDRGHGRFPFLLPSNIFHPYYLKILQKAQEPKLTVESFQNKKEEFKGDVNKKTSISRENGKSVAESDDIPFDFEKKEKFKMVINKSKKDGSDMPIKEPQPQVGVQVDAAQVTAILQAATRGITHPNLDVLFGKPSDSTNTNMTREQKLKAERLKRAKMFVAQLKSGAGSSKGEPSAEPSTTTIDIGTSDKRVKSEKEYLDEERRAKRKYRGRGEPKETREHEEEDDDREGKRSRKKKHRSHFHSDEDESEEKYKDEKEYKPVKRKHRSHRSSSYKHDDMDKNTEEKDHKYSRKKHRPRHSSHDDVSDDETDSDHKYSRKKHSRKSSHHRNKHRKLASSIDHNKADKNAKGSNSEREELEEGEIGSKSGQPSVDQTSQSSEKITEVPDDLRAKIRAMLMSTM